MSPRDGTCLVKHHRVNIRQRFNEISPLYQDPDLGALLMAAEKAVAVDSFSPQEKSIKNIFRTRWTSLVAA